MTMHESTPIPSLTLPDDRISGLPVSSKPRLRGTRWLVFGLGWILCAVVMGVVGSWHDWVAVVQVMIGCLLLGFVPLFTGAVLMVLDAERWAKARVSTMTDAEVEALMQKMGVGDE